MRWLSGFFIVCVDGGRWNCDGSYDDLQLPPIGDLCQIHSIPHTDGPPPPNYLASITDGAHNDLFPVSLTVDNLTAHSLIIELPPNIYSLKVQNKYIPLEYCTKINGGIFDYNHFVKSMFKPTSDWKNHKSTDMITYSEEINWAELGKSLNIIPNVTQEICERIISLIKQYWDYFSKWVCRRTIILLCTIQIE